MRRSKETDPKPSRAVFDGIYASRHSSDNNSVDESVGRMSVGNAELNLSSPDNPHRAPPSQRKHGTRSNLVGRPSKKALAARRGSGSGSSRVNGRPSAQSLQESPLLTSSNEFPSYSNVALHDPVVSVSSPSLNTMDQSQMYVSTSTWWRLNSKSLEGDAELDTFCWICHKSGEVNADIFIIP